MKRAIRFYLLLTITTMLIIGSGIAIAQQATIKTNPPPISNPPGKLLAVTTVGALPPCNAAEAGYLLAVTDASSPTFNATLTGGSTTFALALCNGTVWTSP